MEKNFADILLSAIDEKRNPSIVGLDPRIDLIPEHIKSKHCNNEREAVAETFINFNKTIIDAIYDIIPAVKPQLAFYEQYGYHGIIAFEETVKYAKSKGLIVIADGKRNDIGSTASAYADAFLGEIQTCSGKLIRGFDVDAMTVNPYLGWDGVKPFIEVCRKNIKGIFILVKTSNPSSVDLQDLIIDNQPLYEKLAILMNKWGENTEGQRGYRFMGAVIGATFPQQAERLRKLMPKNIFLVPGYGAQGGTAKDISVCFNPDGYGAIINSSRGIIFAYMDEKWKKIYNPRQFDSAARSAVIAMRDEIKSFIKK